jgi:streptogramin lyase
MAALTVCVMAGVPLVAQTVHYGATVTLGSGFSEPTGVAVDGSGNVYVADFGNSAIKEIVAVNGSIPASPTINTLGSGFLAPFTVAVDASGNVFLTDYGHDQVKEILAVNGVIPTSPTIRVLGGGFSFIFGVAVEGNGDVLVTDYGHNMVKELVAINGSVPAVPKILNLGSGFNIPAGVAVDASGNVFIGDQNNNAVKEILASSGYTSVITLATAGFNTPDGVAVDSIGNVYVADDGNNLVKEIVAVNGVIPASPTILTLGSGFLQTFDVAVDKNRNVYVADRGNNAIKEIVIAGGNFGSVNVGTSSTSPVTLYFTFDTAGTLGSTAVLTQGVAGLDFTDAGGGTCVAGTAYGAGDVCTVNVNFTPLVPGPRLGAAELLSTTGNLLATGYVQGIGVGPQTSFANTTSGISIPNTQLALSSGFSYPGGVAADASGNVFVADSSNNAVKEIVAAGGYSTVKYLGGGFNYPSAVAVDGAGNVFVADTINQAVEEIVAAGGYSTVNSLGSGFEAPYGVAVDGSDNVFVADYATDTVKEIISVNGAFPASPNIRILASGLAGPDGVAVDGSGNVFVANYDDGTIQEILAVNGSVPATPTIKTIASGLYGPSNLSVDASGNVFVADFGNNAVKELVAAGGYTTVKVLGSGFNSPEGVALLKNGSVIVADSGNSAIDLLDFINPPSLTFAAAAVGSTSSDSPRTVTVSNVGTALLTTGAGSSIPANFAWDSTSTCTSTWSPFSLANGQSCTMAFDFKPTAGGALTGLAVWTDNNLNAAGTLQSIQLAGTGLLTQTITFTQPTTPVTYGAAPVTLTATSTSGLTVSFASTTPTICTVASGKVSFIAGGTCTIQATQAGNSIYAAATPVSRSIKVNPAAQTITFAQPATPVTYGAAAEAVAATSTSGLTVSLASTTPTICTVASGKVSFIAGGTCTVQATQAGNSKYASATPVSRSITVNPAAQTITFGSIAAQIVGTPLNLSATATSGLTVTFTSTTQTICTVSGTTATFIAPGTCTIQANQAGNSNYSAAPMVARNITVYQPAVLTAPTAGSTLTSSSATFTWTPVAGATSYSLLVGSTGVGSGNLYYKNTTAGTLTDNNLPVNGETLYVRLKTSFNGIWTYNDYTFTAFTKK